MTIFRSTNAATLQKTLDGIIDDKADKIESGLYYRKWMAEETIDGAYSDYQEYAGPGYAYQIPEGTEVPEAGMFQGPMTRFMPNKYGLRMIITEEAIEDCKYKEVIDLARRNKRAVWKTVEVTAHDILNRMFNTSYPLADGLPLGSASHILPNGGTASNVMSTPLSPSITALSTAVTDLMKMVGHDGTIEGYQAKRIVCPADQWAVWKGILGSADSPETYQGINVVSKAHLGIEGDPVATPWWNSSATQWAVQTDCDNRPTKVWNRKPRGKTYVDEPHECMVYSSTARWDDGCADYRTFYCVEA